MKHCWHQSKDSRMNTSMTTEVTCCYCGTYVMAEYKYAQLEGHGPLHPNLKISHWEVPDYQDVDCPKRVSERPQPPPAPSAAS